MESLIIFLIFGLPAIIPLSPSEPDEAAAAAPFWFIQGLVTNGVIREDCFLNGSIVLLNVAVKWNVKSSLNSNPKCLVWNGPEIIKAPLKCLKEIKEWNDKNWGNR